MLKPLGWRENSEALTTEKQLTKIPGEDMPPLHTSDLLSQTTNANDYWALWMSASQGLSELSFATHLNVPLFLSPVSYFSSGQADGCRWLRQHGTVHCLCFRIIHTPKHSHEVMQHLSSSTSFDLFHLYLCLYSIHETFPTGTLNVRCSCTYWMWWGKRCVWNPWNWVQAQPMWCTVKGQGCPAGSWADRGEHLGFGVDQCFCEGLSGDTPSLHLRSESWKYWGQALPPAHLLEDCEMILKPVLVASLSSFIEHKARLWALTVVGERSGTRAEALQGDVQAQNLFWINWSQDQSIKVQPISLHWYKALTWQ